jgi:hypothetical protein
MINKKILLTVLLISIIFSFAASLMEITLFHYMGTRSTMTHEDWSKLDSMSHKEAMEYMDSHQVEMGRLETLWEFFSSPYKFFFFITFLFPKFFIPVFLASIFTAWRVLKTNSYGTTDNISEDHST